MGVLIKTERISYLPEHPYPYITTDNNKNHYSYNNLLIREPLLRFV